MNKTDLINAIAMKSGLDRKEAAIALSATMDAITRALAAGDKVQLLGFGTFDTKLREARTGRNPTTGEPLEIPAARLPVFKPGKELKDAVDF